MKHPILLGGAACLALASCAIKDPPAGADILTERARGRIPGHWSAPHRRGDVVPNWIRTFGDPELTRIVEDAVTRNPDLAAAAARVAAAGLYPRIAMKGLGERQGREIGGNKGSAIDPPDLGGLGVDTSGGAGDTSSTDSSSQRWVMGIGIGASWEADVWGRVRSRKAAAKADADALEADYEYARQSLAAAVARAYFSTIEAAQQAANAEETLGLYEEYGKLSEVRKQQGFASDFELAQLKTRTAAAKDTLYTAEQ